MATSDTPALLSTTLAVSEQPQYLPLCHVAPTVTVPPVPKSPTEPNPSAVLLQSKAERLRGLATHDAIDKRMTTADQPLQHEQALVHAVLDSIFGEDMMMADEKPQASSASQPLLLEADQRLPTSSDPSAMTRDHENTIKEKEDPNYPPLSATTQAIMRATLDALFGFEDSEEPPVSATSVLDVNTAPVLSAGSASAADAAPALPSAPPPPSLLRPKAQRKAKRRSLQPTLAGLWEKEAHRFSDDQAFLVSPKMDGVRCLAGFDAGRGEPFLLSRSGKPLHCDDIRKLLLPLFKEDPELVLDGELYIHGAAFGDIVSAARAFETNPVDFSSLTMAAPSSNVSSSFASKVPSNDKTSCNSAGMTKAAIRQQQQHFKAAMQLHVFDVMHTSVMDPQRTPFSDRTAFVASLLEKHKDALCGRVLPVEQLLLHKGEIDLHGGDLLRARYEGAMIRVPDSVYEHNRAPTSLMKLKAMYEDEYVIVDVIPGSGFLEGEIGSLQLITDSGELFSAGIAVNEMGISRAEMTKNKGSLFGKTATVTYQELTKAGVPRFPSVKAIRGSVDGKDWL